MKACAATLHKKTAGAAPLPDFFPNRHRFLPHFREKRFTLVPELLQAALPLALITSSARRPVSSAMWSNLAT